MVKKEIKFNKSAELEVLYADVFSVVNYESSENDIVKLSRIQHPFLEEYLDDSVKVNNIWQVMTPEGTVFEFSEAKEGQSVIITDPTSKKDYEVRF